MNELDGRHPTEWVMIYGRKLTGAGGGQEAW